MARIAFFSERLPTEFHDPTSIDARDPITAFSYGLMTSLAEQQHDVRVYSTYREGELPPPSQPRLQILRPFRNWGWLEIPKVIPILLDFQPELIHIIQPRAEALRGLTNALTALPSLAPLMGRPRFVISLYDVQKEELNRNRTLLSLTDVVIVTNRQQADEVTRWYNGPRKPNIEIVPLPSGESEYARDLVGQPSVHEIEVMPALDMLSARCSSLLLVPGDVSDQRDPKALFSMLNDVMSQIPDLGVIFGGGWGSLSVSERRDLMRTFEDRGHGARVLLTGPLSANQESTCLENSKLVFLAGLADSSLTVARWIRQSLKAERSSILRDLQCRLDPLKWQNRLNALIVSSETTSWGPALAELILDHDLRNAIQRKLPDFARAEAIDEPGNALSRIYAQVLRTPRNPLR